MKAIIPRRKIEGVSAVLLPFREDGQPDLGAFAVHLERTLQAGLIPAVNMDTGYVNLLTMEQRRQILTLTSQVLQGRPFVAGAFIEDEDGNILDLYRKQMESITEQGGTPILFQSTALNGLSTTELIELHQKLADSCPKWLIFELGGQFAPFGRIYPPQIIADLIQIPAIIGLKHSSLSRELEWQRLELRNHLRPDFTIYTGNDLAIDMVMYGSDYLLGLSTFAPDFFALRDRYWEQGDIRFYALNDVLQYLGRFAFRPPVPAYKHSAAQFLKLRGWLACDKPHPQSSRRPASDLEVLNSILSELETYSLK